MLAKAGVRAEQRDATAGDDDVVRTTGARRPSGVPVAAKPDRRRPARNGGPRPARNGGSRRPRRPRS
jgi:hypothetical protein